MTVWYSIENNMTRDAVRANFLGLGLIRTRLFRGPDVFPHPVHQTIYTPNLRQFAIDWFSRGVDRIGLRAGPLRTVSVRLGAYEIHFSC